MEGLIEKLEEEMEVAQTAMKFHLETLVATESTDDEKEVAKEAVMAIIEDCPLIVLFLIENAEKHGVSVPKEILELREMFKFHSELQILKTVMEVG